MSHDTETARFYHRTSSEVAQAILDSGFRDSSGTYGTSRSWTGVWISDRPLDANEGAEGDALLAIDLTPDDFRALADYEWIEERKTYREWLVPAAFLNTRGMVAPVTDEDFGVIDALALAKKVLAFWEAHAELQGAVQPP